MNLKDIFFYPPPADDCGADTDFAERVQRKLEHQRWCEEYPYLKFIYIIPAWVYILWLLGLLAFGLHSCLAIL